MNASMHNVVSVTARPTQNFNSFSARSFIFRDDKGNVFEVVAYSDAPENLNVKEKDY
jgi:hypothetical protein